MEDPDHGLLPGMGRIRGGIDAGIVRRMRDSVARPRETMRIKPLGAKRESLIGQVTAIHTVDLARRLGLQSGSIGAQLVGNRFPGLRAVQITILVDHIDMEPDAEDLFSYTFWCEVSSVAESVTREDVIQVEVEPVEMLGMDSHWVAESLEIL